MGEKFLRLKQRDKTVEQYAAEFHRLSRFAPNMVREEIDRGSRLQQGLRIGIKKHLASHQLDTYDQVLTAARRVERVENEENRNGQQKQAKRPHDQIQRGPALPQNGPQPNKRQQQPQAPKICDFCKKPGHIQRECRQANGWCLICGSKEHEAARCLSRIPGYVLNQYQIPYALPTPPIAAVPVQARPPPPQQNRAQQ